MGTELVEVLLAARADTEKSDKGGNVPLHYAAAYGRVPVVQALLDGGANPVACNSAGKTPGDMALLDEENPVLEDLALMSRLDSDKAFEERMERIKQITPITTTKKSLW